MKTNNNDPKTIPAYIKLYRQLRKSIVEGDYPAGSKLPSKRTIAADGGVSVITAEHALDLLTEEGYIEPHERSGYFVIFQRSSGFAGTEHDELEADDSVSAGLKDELVSSALSDGQGTELAATDDFPFSVLAKTMRKVLSDNGKALLERSPNEGTIFLRAEICHYLARSRGIHVRPEQVIIGAGSEYLYHLLIGLFGTERIYGLESPSYPMIENVCRLSGVHYEMLPLGKDGIKSSALSNTKATILHLTPYRSFPSGVTASASKRHAYLEWAKAKGRYLIEDDYESEFSVLRKPEDTLFSMTEDENVIYLNTFSKSISPSLRVGYMLLPPTLVSNYQERLGFYSCTVPTMVQYVLAELLRNGDFERHINRVRRRRRKEREHA